MGRERRMSSRTAWLVTNLICVLVMGCSSDGDSVVEPEPSPPPAAPDPDPLPIGVYKLTGTNPDFSYVDLDPLRRIIGSARFVALGESTHTSGGYYQAKARLIRYMVEQLGFRVVTMETPWLEAAAAERYVATCAGTPEDALRSLNGVWRDTNVRDLLRWLCEYNRANPADPVTFFGFDIQEPGLSTDHVRQFIDAAAPGEEGRGEPLLNCLGAPYLVLADFYRSQQYRDLLGGQRDAAAHDACIAAISDLEAWIASNAVVLQTATSAAQVEHSRLALVALRAWENQLWVPNPGGYQARDYGMAELLRRLHALYTPNRKTVIWAWNWHIARRYEEVHGFDDDPQAPVSRQGARAMGGFLHDAYGNDYLPIALIGYRVEINSGGVTPPLQVHPESVERRLHDLGWNVLLVDLRQPLPESLLPVGGTFRVSQEWGDPYRQFGALLFLDYSPPMSYVP